MNRCEKYADWLADAAADGLAPSRERELLEHAAECDACRMASQHAREIVAIVDDVVESLVTGEPSPHFATRLRARIEQEGIPTRSPRLGWKTITAGAVVVVFLGVLIISYGTRQHNSEATALDLRADANSTETSAAALPHGTQRQTQVRNRDQSPTVHQREMTPFISRRNHPMRESGAVSQPDVLVPPGQLDAILQFARAVRSGQIDGKQLLAAQQETEKPLEITPIEIAPLSPPQPEVASNTPDDGRK